MKFYKSEKGGSLAEFALVLPILLIITFGMIEFGIMLYNQQVITNAAREGARLGILQAATRATTADIQDRVHAYADANVISFLATRPVPVITVTRDGAPGVCTDFRQNLAVTVNYNFQYLVVGNLIPGLGNGVTLGSTATMRCE